MKRILLIPWAIAIMIFYILYCDKINASQIYDKYQWIGTYYSDQNLTNARGDDGLYSYFDATTSATYNGGYTYNFNYFNSLDLSNYKDGQVQFEYELALPQIYVSQNSTIYGDDYCNRWGWSSIDSNNQVIRWDCDRVSNSQDSTITDREYIYPRYSIKAYLMSGSTNYAVPCEVNQNTNRIICPISTYINDIHGLRVDTKVFYMSNTTSNYRFKFGKQMLIYKNTDTIINGSINNQTQQQQTNYDNFMNETHQYDDTPSEEINGTTEMNEYSQVEDNLMNNIDLNMSVMDGITINPLASAYIWDIASSLRNINPKIILLMTSILGLGIIKMVLNR